MKLFFALLTLSLVSSGIAGFLLQHAPAASPKQVHAMDGQMPPKN